MPCLNLKNISSKAVAQQNTATTKQRANYALPAEVESAGRMTKCGIHLITCVAIQREGISHARYPWTSTGSFVPALSTSALRAGRLKVLPSIVKRIGLDTLKKISR